MTSKGASAFPPRDRDMNCRQCSGYGWVAFTIREQDLVEQLDSCHQEVFGRPYFEVDYIGGEVPRQSFCPKCCGQERLARTETQFAQWRLDLRALRTLVIRVRRGETFSYSQLDTEEWTVKAMTHELTDLAWKRHSTWESRLMYLANSPRVAKSSASRKKSRPNPSLVEELTQLASLRSSGALTKEEFKRAKQKLLGSISPAKRKLQALRQEDEDMGPPDLPEDNESKISVGDRVSHSGLGPQATPRKPRKRKQ